MSQSSLESISKLNPEVEVGPSGLADGGRHLWDLCRRQFARHWVLILISLLAAALRGFALGRYSLWMDEARQTSFYFTVSNIVSMVGRAATQQQPPLDYLLGYLVTRSLSAMFGFQEWMARLPAFVFGVSLVPMAYFLARDLTHEGRESSGELWRSVAAGLLAASLVALSPVLVAASQEARPYSIYFFFLLYWSWSWLKWWRNDGASSPRRLQWATFLFLMSRGMAPLVYVVVVACFTGVFSPDVRGRLKVLVWPMMAFMPFQLLIILSSGQYLGSSQVALGVWRPWLALDRLAQVLRTEVFSGYRWGAFVASAIVLFASVKRRGILLFATAIIFFEPMLHAGIYSFLVKSEVARMQGRYFLYLVPCLAILASAAAAIYVPVRGRLALALIPLSFVIVAWPEWQVHYSREKTDYRGAWRVLTARWKRDDVALYSGFQSPGAWQSPFYGEGFYYPRGLAQMDLIELADEVERHPERPGRVWLLLHESTDRMQAEAAGLRVWSFQGLMVAQSQTDAGLLRENLTQLLQAMLRFYPETSARQPLLASLARLNCRFHPEAARAAIDEWRRWQPSLGGGFDPSRDCH